MISFLLFELCFSRDWSVSIEVVKFMSVGLFVVFPCYSLCVFQVCSNILISFLILVICVFSLFFLCQSRQRFVNFIALFKEPASCSINFPLLLFVSVSLISVLQDFLLSACSDLSGLLLFLFCVLEVKGYLFVTFPLFQSKPLVLQFSFLALLQLYSTNFDISCFQLHSFLCIFQFPCDFLFDSLTVQKCVVQFPGIRGFSCCLSVICFRFDSITVREHTVQFHFFNWMRFALWARICQVKCILVCILQAVEKNVCSAVVAHSVNVDQMLLVDGVEFFCILPDFICSCSINC